MKPTLKEVRKSANLSPTETAAAIGVSEQTLLRWERDWEQERSIKNARFAAVEKLAAVLDLPLNFFADNN